jgi:hypothetical protein
MAEGFSNPIIGGSGGLVYPSIHSPNYVNGVSGWTIRKDGSAEFSGLVLRGTFLGTQYEINSLGAFFYSGVPATGNLIASITPAAGPDDGHGNAFKAGITSYQAATGTFGELLNGLLTFGKTGSGFASDPNMGTDSGGQLLILNSASNGVNTGTEIALDLQNVLIQKQAGASTGSLLTVQGILTALGADALPGLHPGTANTPETWQSMNTRGYQNGWLDGGRVPGQYRLEAAPANSVSLVGSLTVPVGFAVGQTIVNLPAGYRPAAGKDQSILGRDININGVLAGFSLGSAGNLTWRGGTSAVSVGDIIDFEGRVYLDA